MQIDDFVSLVRSVVNMLAEQCISIRMSKLQPRGVKYAIGFAAVDLLLVFIELPNEPSGLQ